MRSKRVPQLHGCLFKFTLRDYAMPLHYMKWQKCFNQLTLEALGQGGGGWGQIDPPSIFFGFKFLLLDRLSKALVQLFFVR